MTSRKTLVTNPTGIHARPASEFIRTAKQYSSKITVARAEEPDSAVNAKSIVMLLSLSLDQGSEIVISADGADEEAALDALIALVDSRFGE